MKKIKKGSIYWLDLDPTLGHEQAGYRPVLVVSATAFNTSTHLPVVVPITNGGNFAKRLGFTVTLEPTLRTQGIIRCDQPRTVDLTKRKAKFIECVSQNTLDEVTARLVTIFE